MGWLGRLEFLVGLKILGMEIPKTIIGSFVLIRAEVVTGIVLNFDDTRYFHEGENYYKVFDAMEEVKTFIQFDKKRSTVEAEYTIFDHDGQFLECIS
jgi:hypothetical protein